METLSPWREQIRQLAEAPNVCCKVSGMVTEAKLGQWTSQDFQPYLDVVFEAFGEERLLFGSDWPVCLLSATYAQVFDILRDYLKPLSESARARIMGGNAVHFYGLEARGIILHASKTGSSLVSGE